MSETTTIDIRIILPANDDNPEGENIVKQLIEDLTEAGYPPTTVQLLREETE